MKTNKETVTPEDDINIKEPFTAPMKEMILSAKHLLKPKESSLKLEDRTGEGTRGFKLFSFVDKYDNDCSLQMSSFAGVLEEIYSDDNDPRIWFGMESPRIVAYGDNDSENIGKVVELVPPMVEGYHTMISSRMCLSQSQVKELLPYLTKFAETGEL